MGKKQIKKAGIALSVLLMCTVTLLLVSVIGAKGATYTWDTLGELDATYSHLMPLSDITSYNYQGTTNNSKIYSDCSHYFDDVQLDTNSRVTYGKKIKVRKGQEISVVAAQEDTADEGGASVSAGMFFYWTIHEYNSEGILVYDGDWRSSSETWTVGETINNQAYGKDGYPYGSGANERANVQYIVIIFRWNNGDLAEGSGMDIELDAGDIVRTFPNFYLVTTPFAYVFDGNGGTAVIDGNSMHQYSLKRLGISDVQDTIVVPTKTGYTCTGWKITGNDGKQAGKIYSTDQLNSMFRDGKYWSSLFSNIVYFQAQWTPNTYYVQYDNNWGNAADWGDGLGSVNIHKQTCTYDNTENILANKYQKDGYVFKGWNTERDGSGIWYKVNDSFSNLTAESGGVITLYAQWTKSRSFVEYMGNGQTSGDDYLKGYWSVNNDNYDTGSVFTKDDYKFKAWDVSRQVNNEYVGEKNSSDSIEDIDGITTLTSKSNTSQCIEVTDDTFSDCASVRIGSLGNEDGKRFAFEWAGKDSYGDYYVIRHNAGGRVLDINSAVMDGDSNKHEVRLRDYVEGSVFQQWYVEITGDSGYVKLRSRWGVGGYLDNYNGYVYTYSGNNNDSQKWSLTWIKFNASAQWSITIDGATTLRFDANGGTLTGEWSAVNNWWTSQGVQLEFKESINSSRTVGTVSVLKDNVYYNVMDKKPVWEGCIFTGWFTEPENGKGEQVYYYDGRCKESEYWDKDYNAKEGFDERAKWQSDKKEVVLYAHWEKTEYTVTLDLNKPAYALSSPTYDTSYSLSYNVWYKHDTNNNISHYKPALDRYEFLGWFTESSGGEQIYNEYGEYVGDTSCWDRNGNWIYSAGKKLFAQW